MSELSRIIVQPFCPAANGPALRSVRSLRYFEVRAKAREAGLLLVHLAGAVLHSS